MLDHISGPRHEPAASVIEGRKLSHARAHPLAAEPSVQPGLPGEHAQLLQHILWRVTRDDHAAPVDVEPLAMADRATPLL